MRVPQNTFLFLLVLGCSTCQKLWHSNFMGISDKPRNEFILRNVTLDQKFSLNAKVDFWRSSNSRYSSYAVGVSEEIIFVVNVTKTEDPRDFNISYKSKLVSESYKDGRIIDLPYKNEKHGGIFFVCFSSEKKLQWINIKTLDLEWTWNLGYKPDSIKFGYNNVINRNQIFLKSNNILYIYHFDVESRQLWLSETLELTDPIGEFDTVSFRNRFHLLVPQKELGKLLIYKYVEDHFESFKNISSEKIEQVVGFQIKFKSYFAVDGLEAGIYRFDQRNRIIQEQIADSHFEGIKYWMPVTVNNLRKNFFLLGERVIRHGPVTSFVTETFVHNGEHFEEHEDIPCQIFGEEFNSLNCFITPDAVGIRDAAEVSLGNNLGLLLAKRSPHNLFRVKFDVKELDSPIREKMKEVQKIREELQKRVDEKLKNITSEPIVKAIHIEPVQSDPVKTSASQTKINTTQIEGQKNAPIVGASNDAPFLEKINKILERLIQLQEKLQKVEKMEEAGNFKELVIPEKSKINSVAVENVTCESINDEPVNELLEDIVRKNSNQTVGGTKTFTDLNVKNLFFDSINGIKSENMMFLDSDNIIINGNVIFDNPIAVMKNIKANTINGMPADSISNLAERIEGTLSFEKLEVENLDADFVGEPRALTDNFVVDEISLENTVVKIPHNLTVKRINGEDFETFLKQLCLVNIRNHLPGDITIKGEINFEDHSIIGHLNDIKFPEDYVSSSSADDISITGKKVFRTHMVTKALNTNDHYINEFKSTDFFTLSTEQYIPGNATFQNLEISKKFLHKGKTVGRNLQKILPNPTLAQTFNIKANVNFENLEVSGSIIVEDMDGFSYGKILEDIIYRDEENPTINSIKEFSEGLTIKNNLDITTNSINRISLDQIVTKDSLQVLNIPTLNGNVTIESLKIEKFINNVNITKLDEESMKTFGEQFISAYLIFDGDLEIENLEVKESLNEEPVENYHFTTGDRIFNQQPKFENIEVENLSVMKNVEGKLEDIDLEDFTKNRLTYTTAQSLTAPIDLVNSQTGRLDCQKNTELCRSLPTEEKMRDDMMSKISSGAVTIKELSVKDDLRVEQMNGILLSQQHQLNKSSSVIDGDVYFTNLHVSKLVGVSIRELLDDSVFKNETNVEIFGLKAFRKGFTVKKLIETSSLNNVLVENLMTKQGEQIIEAPIEIFGNVTFSNNVDIAETINGVPVEKIREYFEYKDGIFFLKGDVLFNRLTYIDNLDVFENINGKNFDEVFGNIAYLDQPLHFYNDVEFRDSVNIKGNLDIKDHLNGISLSDSNDNIVYLDKTEDNTIDSPVTFTAENTFAHNLSIETNLITKWMRGLDLDTFRDNAIFINKGFLEGNYHFQNMTIHEKLVTEVMNKVNMSRVIPLASDQEIDQLIIDNVVFLNDVTVENSVNGFDLRTEYPKSVLSNEDQVITSEIYFKNNTLIRHNLEVEGLLNHHPIDKIVSTDTNQTLTATYEFFSKTSLESNMYVSGLVNSINISEWGKGAVKHVSQEPQVIQAPWNFGGNLSFEDSLESGNGIFDFDVEEASKYWEGEKDFKKRMETQYEKDHESICKDIRSVNKESKKQTYKFESLEEMQQFEYRRDIGKVHFFDFEKPSMMLNGIGSCSVDLFIMNDGIFFKENTFEMGEIDQIISVEADEEMFFVVKTKLNPKCKEGVFVWRYINETVKEIQNIDNQKVLQESKVPSTFYGLNKNGVTEFRVDMSQAVPVEAYRKWKIREDDAAFMPRGLGTGLAIRTGKKIMKLMREEPQIDNEIGFGSTTIKGEMKVFENSIVPGKSNSKITVVRVGPKGLRKTLLAIVFHEDTVVGRDFDVLKIYEDYSKNILFQEIYTHNPTAIVPLELENGESFLLVLENEEKLQIYRYRGVEGFRKYLSAEIPGNAMYKMSLPIGPDDRFVETVAIVNNEKIKILKPIMTGNPTKEDIECP